MRRLPALLLALHTMAALALPALADAPPPLPRPSGLRSDILYTHKGEFVQVAPMRALTLNAHVEQFAYDPLGLEIAVAGYETSGETVTHFVKTLDARTGHEMSRLTLKDSVEFSPLLGWSASGKYLLLRRAASDPETGLDVSEFLRWDLSADPPASRVIQPRNVLPADIQADAYTGSVSCYPSPTGRWFLFSQRVRTHAASGKRGPDAEALVLYDPERDTLRPLTLPAGEKSYSWGDAMHLNLVGKSQQFDVVSGQISPSPAARPADTSAVSKHYPDLSWEVSADTVQDSKRSGGLLGIDTIWIRRTPFGRLPLGIAPAGLLPSGSGIFTTTNQVQWSPGGTQIAFVAHGDLWVTDLLTPTETLPNEKLAAGLKLSCPEERELAQSNLKQIGLGILQYTQDADEVYPPAAGWAKAIMPYVRTNDLFAVDGHAVVYEEPAGHTMASVDEPASTEMGYIDLPCAHVVLFCDGHVKVFAK